MDYEEILDLALDQVSKSGAAVPGAKFRSFVSKIAADNHVQFPPDGMSSFAKFLENFPHKVIIQRTPGRDIQIAPIGRGELLAEPTVSSPFTRIREDFFSALTALPNPKEPVTHYYSIETDEVFCQSSAVEMPVDGIPLPPGGLEQEVEVRRAFIDGVKLDSTIKGKLSEALDGAKPLASFTHAARAYGVAQKWHKFRLKALAQKLKDWSDERGLIWQPTWVTGSPGKSPAVIAEVAEPLVDEELENGLQSFLARLSREDVSRISVPLDVVLKLLSHK